jgi:hypothetical protein
MTEPGQDLPAASEALVRGVFARHLAGIPVAFEIVDQIPLTAAGKRRLVVSELNAG